MKFNFLTADGIPLEVYQNAGFAKYGATIDGVNYVEADTTQFGEWETFRREVIRQWRLTADSQSATVQVFNPKGPYR